MPKNKKVKIILLGVPGVGKTALLQRFNKKNFLKTYQPTQGVDFVNKTIHTKNDDAVDLQILDCAGNSEDLGTSVYRKADAYIFVVDATNPASLNILNDQGIAKQLHVSQKDAVAKSILVVTKFDKKKSAAMISIDKIAEIAQEHGLDFDPKVCVTNAAANNSNVKKFFHYVITLTSRAEIIRRPILQDEWKGAVTVTVMQPKKKNNSCCCCWSGFFAWFQREEDDETKRELAPMIRQRL